MTTSILQPLYNTAQAQAALGQLQRDTSTTLAANAAYWYGLEIQGVTLVSLVTVLVVWLPPAVQQIQWWRYTHASR